MLELLFSTKILGIKIIEYTLDITRDLKDSENLLTSAPIFLWITRKEDDLITCFVFPSKVLFELLRLIV